MTLTGEQREQILDLAGDVVDGVAAQEQVNQLELLLETGEEARTLFLDYTLLHGTLASADATLRPLSVTHTFATPISIRSNTIWRLAAMLSLFASVAGILWLTSPLDTSETTNPYAYNLDASAKTVASLDEISEEADLRWRGAEDRVTTGSRLGIGTLQLTRGKASIRFLDGAVVQLVGPALFSIDGANHGGLLAGKMSAHVPPSAHGFEIKTTGLKIVDRGTNFGVSLNAEGQTEVQVFTGMVEAQPRQRMPKMYWSFDDPMLTEYWSHQPAQRNGQVEIAPGLIGTGAVLLHNDVGANLNVGNGGGTHPGTGHFAVTTGLSIEAMFVSRWSGEGYSTGKPLDYDEIFRKEDGHYRMLLSFQNDSGHHAVSKPAVPAGPCLSFGLHLSGDGYSELDMPLDGLEGRPTLSQLTDGKPHHLVATYDSATGRKAIYLDGVCRFETHFSPGTVVISGGASPAAIGNTMTHARANEPFTGLIDEVAFYDFALSDQEIAEHHQQVRSGQNYFGGDLTKPAIPVQVAEGQSQRFAGTARDPTR